MHNPKKKPSRGVCQVCGKAVVAIERPVYGGCFGPVFETSGHTYNQNGKLVEVRCPEHYQGIRVNTRALNAPPTPEELALAENIRRSNKKDD